MNINDLIKNNYKESPEISLYQEHQRNNDSPFVQDAILLLTRILPADWLVQFVEDGKIDSLSPYLQRILLTHVWKLNNNFKAKSFIRSVWEGLGHLQPLAFIRAQIILENIIEAIENETNEDIISQIIEVKEAIEQKIKDGVLLINLDGQTRTNCAVTPYIKSEFNLLNDGNQKPIPVLNSTGEYVDITPYVFSKLDGVQRGHFLSQTFIMNFITSYGSFDCN